MTDNYEEYSRDDLLRLLRERDRKPRFGLVWERDEIDHDNSVNNDFIALDYDPELSHGDGPHENLLIEGDNFDALRYLRMTHAGKVKCIYIDPPYNTGNKDFIYNDHFVDPDDVYKHSKWLEFIYRRLILARDLLREDGVLFASIDDNEYPYLTLLLDQVFTGMRVASFVWKRRSSSAMAENFVSTDHEYVLCYAMPGFEGFKGNKKDFAAYSNPDNDPRGDWTLGDLTVGMGKDLRPNQYYDLEDPETGKVFKPNPNRVWAYAPTSMKGLLDEKRVYFPDDATKRPMLKRFKDELKKSVNPVSTWINSPKEKNKDDGVETISSGMTQDGTKLIQNMLGKKAFSYPKPLSLLTGLISQTTKSDDIVLDFFAGSATTAHAVLELNNADGGNRKFIMVSTTEATDDEPEKNVCRDVAQKRLVAAINGYSFKSGKNTKKIEGLGGEFAYLKVKHIPVETVFTEIQHYQIWTALQLIHESGFGDYDDNAAIQIRESENGFIAYIPKLTDEALETIQAAIKGKTNITLYSWQPALLKQRIENSSVSFEPIPQFLTDRFGAGS